jgi:hypothetical protein
MNKKITGIMFLLFVTATYAIGQTKAGSSTDAYTIWLSNSRGEVVKDNNTGESYVVNREFFNAEKVFVLLNPSDKTSSGFSVIINTTGKKKYSSFIEVKGSLLTDDIKQRISESDPDEPVSFHKKVNGKVVSLSIYIK